MPLGRPFRGASTLRYWELPGVICAYAPIFAPNYVASKQNVAALGVYTAEEVTGISAPTWVPLKGWQFNGSVYLTASSLVPQGGWSAFAKFSSVTSNGDETLFGAYSGGSTRFMIWPNRAGSSLYGAGGYSYGTAATSGVLGIAGQQGFYNGYADGNVILGAGWIGTQVLYIGTTYAYIFPLIGNIQGFCCYARTLTSAEAWQASLQMAHPEVPEWNPWARQRQWEIPASGGFLPHWARNVNTYLGGGST